jgi:malate/lactate dehydrogenase
MDKKVTVVGAGNVGATAAQRLCEKALWCSWTLLKACLRERLLT